MAGIRTASLGHSLRSRSSRTTAQTPESRPVASTAARAARRVTSGLRARISSNECARRTEPQGRNRREPSLRDVERPVDGVVEAPGSVNGGSRHRAIGGPRRIPDETSDASCENASTGEAAPQEQRHRLAGSPDSSLHVLDDTLVELDVPKRTGPARAVGDRGATHETPVRVEVVKTRSSQTESPRPRGSLSAPSSRHRLPGQTTQTHRAAVGISS